MPPPRGKSVVYRVTGIPFGPKAYDTLRSLRDDNYSYTIKQIAEAALNDSEGFQGLSDEQQASCFLKAAVKIRQAQDVDTNEDHDLYVDVISSCYNKERLSAIIWFPNTTPTFLSTIRAHPRREMHIGIENVDLQISQNFYGFTQLYRPSGVVIADIIALSGIDGHAFGSWRGRAETGRMWLYDFFPEHFPAARTLLYGYAVKLSERNVSCIEDYAKGFLEELGKIRTTEEEKRRPIFLIGHSFGGLVIQGILIEDDNRNLKLLVPYLKGLIFFGVPHRGLDIEDIRTILHRDSPRHRLLADIAPQAVALQTQRHKFVKILCREKVRIVSFYERQETQKLEMTEGGPRRSAKSYKKSVHAQSAILGLGPYEEVLPVDADHSDMVKFDSQDHTTYNSVKWHLNQMLHREDRKILNSSLRRSGTTSTSPVPDVLGHATTEVSIGQITQGVSKTRLETASDVVTSIDEELKELMTSLHDSLNIQRSEEDIAPPLSDTFEWIWTNREIGFRQWLEERLRARIHKDGHGRTKFQLSENIIAESGYHAPIIHAQTWPQTPPPAPAHVEMPDVEYQYDNGAALGLYRDLEDLENDEYVEFRQPADYEYMDQQSLPRRFYPPSSLLRTDYTHATYSSENVPYTSSPPPLTRCDSTPTRPQTPQTPCYGFPTSAGPLAEFDDTSTHSPPVISDLAELHSDTVAESTLPVRLLHCSRTNEWRPMLRTGIAPAALLFQRWAVEVGPLCSGHCFELEYVGLYKLRFTTPSSNPSFVEGRGNYYDAPKGFKEITSGFTQMGVEEIRVVAEELIQEGYMEYKLGSTDCRDFALELLRRICRRNMWTMARARALIGVDKVVRKGVGPVGNVGMRGLRKLGLLGDEGCW